jgi:hypothetical protein
MSKTFRATAVLLAGSALLVTAESAHAQRSLGLGPAEGAAALAKETDKRFTFVCPASDGTKASVYGTDVYTADSGICAAAIHAGVLQPGIADVVTIVMGSGAESFPSSTRNGVTTKGYGRWGASYTFARDGAPGQIGWRTVWLGIPADFTEPVPVECPAGGALNGGALWGTGVYTKDSTICVAAVHAGAITADRGGVVLVQRAPGLAEYPASARFGIASQRWGQYADAFSVTAAGGVRSVAAGRARPPSAPPVAPANGSLKPSASVPSELAIPRTTLPDLPRSASRATLPPATPPVPTIAPRTIQLAGFTAAGSTTASAVAPRTIQLAGFTASGPSTSVSSIGPRTITTTGWSAVGASGSP